MSLRTATRLDPNRGIFISSLGDSWQQAAVHYTPLRFASGQIAIVWLLFVAGGELMQLENRGYICF